MIICTIIRMLLGTWLRTNETNTLEKAVTAVNAKHITRVVSKPVVTANAEQIPRICNAIGLSSKIGVIKIFFVSLIKFSLLLSLANK